MNIDMITALIVALGGGGLIGAFTTFILKRKDQESSRELGLIPQLQSRITALKSDVEKCNEDRIKLNKDLGALQSQVTSLQKVVDRSADRLVVARVECDEKGIISAWNTAAVALFYWTVTEALGANIDIIIPGNRWDEHHVAMLKSIRGEGQIKPGTGERTIIVSAVTRDGDEIPVNVTLSSFIRDGHLRFLAKIVRR